MKTVVTIGEILVEIMATTVGDGFGAPIPLVGPFPSGAPAIFIDQVAKLGQPCGIVSCVGRDAFGRVNLERLAADGVDVSAVGVDPDRPTGSAFVRYRPDGSRDFVFDIAHSACASVRMTAEAQALIGRADHLHVMGSSLVSESLRGTVWAALDATKARGGTVSFDPNLRKEVMGAAGVREAFDALLSRTDVFLPSGEELFLFCPAADEAGAICDLLGRGPRAVVLKRGASGASYHDGGPSVTVAGFAVDERDPTGAGDCFAGTFVTLWLRGAAPDDALRRACASGALAVTRLGPMEGTSSMAEIDGLLSAGDRR